MNSTPLPPRLLQIVGLIMLSVFMVFWMLTGKESALLVGAALTLTVAAEAQKVLITLRDSTHPAITIEAADGDHVQ